jgi:1-acyl-sn-glycerol-3-phosphate acyltransferase
MRRPCDANPTWTTIWYFARLVQPLFARIRCEGAEYVPLTGGCIITCNHIMGPDFIVVGYACPRQIYYMAKSELFDINPALTWLITSGGAFPINRGEGDLAAVEHALDLVRAGHALGMFPEGTRSRTGKLQRGRSGAARVAILAQAPVVPAVVINAERLFKPENWARLRKRDQIIVRFGPPLPPPTEAEDSRALRTYTRAIMAAMADLLPPEMRTEDQHRAAAEQTDARTNGQAEASA